MSLIWDEFIQGLQSLFTYNPGLYQIILLSLYVSGMATLFCTILGIPIGTFLGIKKFRGINIFKNLIYTFMGLPSVVAGLFIYLLLVNSYAWAHQRLLYTDFAMILVQIVIGLPICAGIAISAIASVSPDIKENAKCLGASPWQASWAVIREARIQLITAVITTFSTCISEVGGVMIVGGNIQFYTRVLSTATMTATSAGDFGYAIALGITLLIIAFAVNIPLVYMQRKKGFLIK